MDTHRPASVVSHNKDHSRATDRPTPKFALKIPILVFYSYHAQEDSAFHNACLSFRVLQVK
jgi:hypothetical protein